MIDAYEIGIQLLVQDDVTAGLAIINRELAEVDRAITVTSAHLGSLIQEANRAAKAVATAVPSGSVRPAANQLRADNKTIAAVEPAQVEAGAKSDPVSQSTVLKPERSPVTIEKSSVPKERTASQASDEKADREASFSMQPSPPTAPIKKGSELLEVPHSEPTVGDKSSLPQSSKAKHTAPALHDSAANTSGHKERRLTVSPTPPASRVGSQVAVTASVRNLQADRSVAQPQASALYHTHSGPAASREQTSVPWAGVRYSRRTGTGSAERRWEAATAPTSPTRDSGGGGGTVMLDGRLVGQWLADHLAREASRPPSGTSFFDPRQTPAWTASGAL